METKVGITLPGILAPRRQPADERTTAHTPASAADVPVAEPVPYRAPPSPADQPNGDDQAYAAAELVRLGYATRVTLVNAALDATLAESWEIRGTQVGLVRLPASRSRLTAGPR